MGRTVRTVSADGSQQQFVGNADYIIISAVIYTDRGIKKDPRVSGSLFYLI